MNRSEIRDPPTESRRRFAPGWLAALFLFITSALVVIWQNSRLGVLWDLSYVLENSYRISLGDIPYRDFPFVHAPLTFLIQAALIRLTGRVFWHHTAYCAAIGGLSTVITWRILRNVLRQVVPHAGLLAFLFSLPLIPLGIYSIFPHPFYDPDCTLAILIGVVLLQRLERKQSSPLLSLLVGASLVVPLFAKQNAGLAFLACGVVLLFALIAIERWRRQPVGRYAFAAAGAMFGLAIALLLIHFTAGLKNYWHWTIQFAAERRTPARADMLGIYADKRMVLWLGLIAFGILLAFLNRHGSRLLMMLSALLVALPFVWPTLYLLRDTDASERAERLLAVWPVLLVFSFVVAVVTIKRRTGIPLVLPFVLIGAIHGAFMSQQLWGSTYAIWPLFVILLATTVSGLASIRPSNPLRLDAGVLQRLKDSRLWMLVPLTALSVLSLLISGGFYVCSNERLSYANLDEGELRRSTLPQLKGLSVRGDWIPNFEELVRYSEREIPREEGILILPGEDPFYYTTGRHPRFPLLFFDHTVNPYAPEEILQICRDRNIRWLIVKQDLQNEDDSVDQGKDQLTEVLEQEFEQVESLKNYDIYRRSDPGKRDEDDDAPN